jgi:hypothetical protein
MDFPTHQHQPARAWCLRVLALGSCSIAFRFPRSAHMGNFHKILNFLSLLLFLTACCLFFTDEHSILP